MKKILLVLLIACFSITSYGQGFLRGKIIDGETGEGLIGATISKEGTSIGAAADFDGNFSLKLDPGIHTVVFQFVSYQTQKVSDIEIKDGKVSTLDVTLKVAATELKEIVVTAEQARDTEVALLTVQRKSPNVVDGISSQTFRKLGDNDLGVAMKRVTGVAVQEGKYVYVRGLGDRYTKTTFSEMSIPGLDPDNNSVQIDIFPTNTIENVIVYKTFSPNLSADFAGGTVDIETKSFPEEKVTSIGLGMSYNPAMNLNKNFLSYDGGKMDFLGFDDGTRKLPFDKKLVIPDISSANKAETEVFTRSFNPQLAAQKKPSFLNYNLGFNHGNQINKGGTTIGYNAVASYRTNYEYYEDVQFGEYIKDADKSVSELTTVETRTGQLGKTDIIWSGLLAGALKFNNHSFALSVLRSQNGTSSASSRLAANQFDNPSILSGNILTYAQRSVTNTILVGKHSFPKLDVEWRGALNLSRIYEPDYRSSRIQVLPDDNFDLQVGVGAGIDRFYRDLTEDNQSFKVDFTVPYGLKNKFKFGGIGTFKSRDFEVLEYYYRIRGSSKVSGNPDDLLSPENIWTPETNLGTYVKGNFDPSKNFNSTQEVYGAYAMTEMQLTSKLKAVYGVRAEQVMMNYSGTNQSQIMLSDTLTLDNLDFLPSANLVYSLNDLMNFRGSYNKTLARPSFKEKSNAQIFDPISKRTFIGNLDLEETHVDNFDLRWEYFYDVGEMVSLSAFYKAFDGHIELVAFETAPDNLKPRNSGQSVVYGMEIEFRKTINELLSIGSNASLVKSAVDLKSVTVNETGGTELELRQANARNGQSIDVTRPMAGQAPFLINGFVNYQNLEGTLSASLSYNVQGETLSIVGSGRVPDIYTKPFNSLNLNVTKSVGVTGRSNLTFGIINILGADRINFYKSFQAADQTFSVFRPGRTFSLKYAYTL